jgi:carbamoyltransferase
MKILGLNFFHADTSAALIIDNKIVSAVEEERFSRIKHFSGFPVQSINYCLKHSKIKFEDLDIISVNSNPYYNLSSKIAYASSNPFQISAYINRLKRLKLKTSIKEYLYRYFGNTKNIKIEYVPHHLSHASSSALCSGFNDGLSLSFDATGDFSTLEIYKFDKTNISKLHSTKFPHSLGILYQAITQFLGFKAYGDEYKVMGLAAHGNPNYVEDIKKLYSFKNGKFKLKLKYFLHHKIGFSFTFNDNFPFYENLFSDKIKEILGEPRNPGDEKVNEKFKDIACSLQMAFQDITLKILNYYSSNQNHKNLFISGGCAFNALNNKFLGKNSNFDNIFIQPNSGDAGGALGSALYSNLKYNKNFQNYKIENIYLGPEEGSENIEKNIHKMIDKQKFDIKNYLNNKDLLQIVAKYLNDGLVVAWHQNRMEFGPRALGNRSILANPKLKEIKSIINKKIKNREIFRPFAPSILKEHADKYFFLEKNMNYNFMNVICDVKQDKADEIPGVINIDKTARPQIVTRENNELYYELISSFYEISKTPLLLNTSLNIQEPICCDSEDTISCFLNSQIDILAIGKFLILRK